MSADPMDPRTVSLFDNLVRGHLRQYGVHVSGGAKPGQALVMPDWVFGQPFALVHPDDALEALERLARYRRGKEASCGPA